MTLEQVLDRVQARLAGAGYANEAAVSQSIVLPVLGALGWDTSDPDEVVPEFANERGRVDYALRIGGRRPAVFVEVKGVGRALEGDRQLFEYAFHEGVPLCALTDGRTWTVYLPSGQGDYDDRRVYRLQLDEREPEHAAERLRRYLARDRVRTGQAQEDAGRDYRNASARRDAERELPAAWRDVAAAADEVLLDMVAEAAEQRCGFRPTAEAVAAFLRSHQPSATAPPQQPRPSRTERRGQAAPAAAEPRNEHAIVEPAPAPTPTPIGAKISYGSFSETLGAPTAKAATVDLLRRLTALHPDRLPELADRVRSRKRAPIARLPEEINPGRPDLANAYELTGGWLVGMHTSNREKTKLLRAACEVMDVRWGEQCGWSCRMAEQVPD